MNTTQGFSEMFTVSKEELKSRVENGIETLNKMIPNWYDEIDVDDLDMSCHLTCVCGQLQGDNYDENLGRMSSCEYGGFTLLFSDTCGRYDSYSRNKAWDFLSDYWRLRILALKAQNV